jgi:hypothetical protein
MGEYRPRSRMLETIRDAARPAPGCGGEERAQAQVAPREVRSTDRDGTATVRLTDRSGPVIGTATLLLRHRCRRGPALVRPSRRWEGT